MSQNSEYQGLKGWIEHRLPIFSFLKHFSQYQAPKNLNYAWNFGSLAGIALVLQIITGILLAMHYTPHIMMAFNSVESIMRDVNYGWLLRYMHAVGASMFFMVVYAHIARGLYYGSYKEPRELLWFFGIIIFLAIDKAKQVYPKIKTSVCGEHAGNPASVSFFNEIGIDYISCSPYRLPIAILAAAQASIRKKILSHS
jgi:hypothetical protein